MRRLLPTAVVMRIPAIAGPIAVAGVALSSACARASHRRPDTPPLIATSAPVVSVDVDTFWAAYDSARTTTDSLAQVRIIQTRYIDRGTPGLHALIAARGYTTEDWVGAIRRYPNYWASIRPNTNRVRDAIRGVELPLARLRVLYPPLRPATVYVTIGALRSSGTTQDDRVLIGAELVAGTPETDISEFSAGMHAFLARYFSTRPITMLVPLNVHEYVHTQQHGIGQTVLARAIREGSADFITELVTGTRMPLPYMTYGPAHEPALREAFKADMFTPLINRWFYNQVSTDPGHVPDLGYYMGYAISRAYFERVSDKRQA